MRDDQMLPLPEPDLGRLALDGGTGEWHETNSPAGHAAYSAEQMRDYARAMLAFVLGVT